VAAAEQPPANGLQSRLVVHDPRMSLSG
jgi:hypothetical protein